MLMIQKHLQKEMIKNYEKISDEIFRLDPKVRCIGILYNDYTMTKIRPGLQNFLSSEEIQCSLNDTLARWYTRQSLQNKLGKPLYAMAEYEKVKRITVPLNENGILLVSTEPTLYHEIIAKEILEIRDRYFGSGKSNCNIK